MNEVIMLILAGCSAGLIAGLFGVGGGVVMVPVLYSVLGLTADEQMNASLMHIALATSLATIFATAISSVLAHAKRGAVNWSWFKRMVPGLMLGAVAGSQVAHYLDTDSLRLVFGVFELLLGITMLRPKAAVSGQSMKPLATWVLATASFAIGKISAIAGIGGGTLSVPFLSKLGFKMQHAVATSAAFGIPIALFGAIGYVVAGWDVAGLPANSLGYINMPAMFALIIGSVFVAPLGARLAHAITAEKLRFMFAILLIVMGIKMLLGDFLFTLL